MTNAVWFRHEPAHPTANQTRDKDCKRKTVTTVLIREVAVSKNSGKVTNTICRLHVAAGKPTAVA